MTYIIFICLRYFKYRKVRFNLLTQRCKNCSKQFKWKSVVKSIWSGYKSIECDNCKSRHHINFVSRLLIALSIPLPLIFQRYLYSIFNSYSLLVYLIWVLFVLLISPYITRYHIKDNTNQ